MYLRNGTINILLLHIYLGYAGAYYGNVLHTHPVILTSMSM